MKTKQLEGISKIIRTIIFSFPSLMNVLALLFLIYFIFAILGVFIFKGTKEDQMVNNDIVNFDNFLNALLVLFRCSTGEDWQLFMYHYSEYKSPVFGRAFFLFYILLSSFVMLNMFTLVVTQQFEEFYFNPDNPITSFTDMAEIFRKQWNFFTWKTKGKKIRERSLVDFFSFLRSPLGYKYVPYDDLSLIENDEFEVDMNTRNIQTIIPRQEIARQIWKMDLPVDKRGHVPFGAV